MLEINEVQQYRTDAQGLAQVKDISFTDGNPANTPRS